MAVEKPVVAQVLDEAEAELNSLNAAVSRMETIVERITGNATPLSEARGQVEVAGIHGHIQAMARETRESTARLEELNNRLSELF